MSSFIQKIRNENEWEEVVSLLEDIKPCDISALKKIIPELLSNEFWQVSAEVLDIIGVYGIAGFEKEIVEILNDTKKNRTLRVYALFSYYDLKESKSRRNFLRKYTENTILDIKLASLCLLYIETEEKEILLKIKKIVMRKNCNYIHQASAISIFEHYIDIQKKPEILKLFHDMLSSVKTEGVEKELKRILG